MSDLQDRRYELAIDDLVVKGLHITFRVEKTLKPDPNTAEITIDGLTNDHRDAMTARKTPIVRLAVGYKDGLTQIFYGTLIHVQHQMLRAVFERRLAQATESRRIGRLASLPRSARRPQRLSCSKRFSKTWG
jgi:hypothetical protein